MASYRYANRGTCSRSVSFDITDGHVSNVRFEGGCDGNTQGICRLIEGMEVHDAIERLRGIDCHGRGTSCPDQLSRNLEKALVQSIEEQSKVC